jgi:hypothetical protein
MVEHLVGMEAVAQNEAYAGQMRWPSCRESASTGRQRQATTAGESGAATGGGSSGGRRMAVARRARLAWGERNNLGAFDLGATGGRARVGK